MERTERDTHELHAQITQWEMNRLIRLNSLRWMQQHCLLVETETTEEHDEKRRTAERRVIRERERAKHQFVFQVLKSANDVSRTNQH